jgi:hypothetical protein
MIQLPNHQQMIMRICGINLLVLAAYSIGLYIIDHTAPQADIFFFIAMALSVGLHVAACLIAAFVFHLMDFRTFQMGFLLSAFAVALLGFSFCFGGEYTRRLQF